jgi:HEPN domain-containing protein
MQLVKQLEEKTKEAAKNREAAENVMSEVEGLIKKAKDMDASVSEGQKFLLEAATSMENKSYEKSYSLAQKAEKSIKAAIEDTINKMIESVANLMDLAGKIGTETKEVHKEIEMARDAMELEDYDGALEHVQKAWEDGERNLHEYMAEAFSTAQSFIVLARNYGEDVSTAEDALSKARGGMDSNDYELAISMTKECLETTSHLLQSSQTHLFSHV